LILRFRVHVLVTFIVIYLLFLLHFVRESTGGFVRSRRDSGLLVVAQRVSTTIEDVENVEEFVGFPLLLFHFTV
jgi:hypothetical protein